MEGRRLLMSYPDAWKNAFAKASNTPADLLVELKKSTNATVNTFFCSTTTAHDELLTIIYMVATGFVKQGTLNQDNPGNVRDGSWIVTYSLV